MGLEGKPNLLLKLMLNPELRSVTRIEHSDGSLTLESSGKQITLNPQAADALWLFVALDTTRIEFEKLITTLSEPLTTMEALVAAADPHDRRGQLGMMKIINRSMVPVDDEVAKYVMEANFRQVEREAEHRKELKAARTPRGLGSFSQPQAIYNPPAHGDDSYRPASDGSGYYNNRTGAHVNELPRETHVDGHYGGYSEPNHWYPDSNGNMVRGKSALDAEYRGQDPWTHG